MKERLKQISREETRTTYSLAAVLNAGAMCAAVKSNMHWAWKAVIGMQFAVYVVNDIVKACLADETATLKTIICAKEES